MIYVIGTQKLRIPETGPERKARTPRQVVPWRDMAETCRNVDAVCRTIPLKTPSIVDGIARSGFWGALFRYRWPKCHLVLNGETEECSAILKEHFPNDKVVYENVRTWTPPKSDISLLDFDTFTLRGLNKWKDVIVRWSPQSKYFMFVDGACFGFKFGTLKHYGVDKEEDYFYLLNKALREIIDKQITTVSKFNNAATLLLEDKRPTKIKFLPPSDMFLSRGGKPYKMKTSHAKRVSLLDL